MERKQLIGQIYGYVICLAAIIVFLTSMGTIISAVFDLSDPLHAVGIGYQQPSLVSFETYKVDILRSPSETYKSSQPTYIPDDEVLRAMYEAAKDDRIQSVRFKARRSLTISSLIIFVAIGLFISHWRWVRKLAKEKA
jgi:hypothetical protein